MTGLSTAVRPPLFGPAEAWAGPVAIVLALAGIVATRVVASRADFDPLLLGAAFGASLTALALFGRRSAPIGEANERRGKARSRVRPVVSSLGMGVAVGVALATLAFVGPAIAGTTYVPGLGRPAAPFVPWALITIAVASAEEGVLRGALFDRVERLAGLAPAIALTTITFALLHVPLYGWHVVPLDLAVGLVLAGLRVGTRGFLAPAAAHVVADLATWWL
jgi:membrane protease YdiL (CAAX protease family)